MGSSMAITCPQLSLTATDCHQLKGPYWHLKLPELSFCGGWKTQALPDVRGWFSLPSPRHLLSPPHQMLSSELWKVYHQAFIACNTTCYDLHRLQRHMLRTTSYAGQAASQPPASRPASKPGSRLTGQPASQPASQPAARPAGQPASMPVSQPANQSASQPASQPARKPALMV